MERFEIETSFGLVASGEQALLEAIREVLRAERERAAEADTLPA